jgi:hypothetical protein
MARAGRFLLQPTPGFAPGRNAVVRMRRYGLHAIRLHSVSADSPARCWRIVVGTPTTFFQSADSEHRGRFPSIRSVVGIADGAVLNVITRRWHHQL